MRSNCSRIVSLAMVVAIFVSSAPFTFAIDEGMFTPGQIATLPLKAKGLKIKPEEIYNPKLAYRGEALFTKPISITFSMGSALLGPTAMALINREIVPRSDYAASMRGSPALHSLAPSACSYWW